MVFIKKHLRNIVGVVAGLVIFLALCNKLNYMYVSYDSWFGILFDSYYAQENIDNIFVGSSHVYCDVNPFLLDDINGQNNFNMASAGQRWDSNYYLLKDAIENHDIENVYLECYYLCSTEYPKYTGTVAGGGETAAAGVIASTAGAESDYKVVDYIQDEDNFTRPWQITYEMKPSFNKYAMLLHSANKDYMMETLFPFVRYRTNVFDWDVVETNIEEKDSEDYKNRTFSSKQWDADGTPYDIEYMKKGYFRTDGRVLDSEKTFLATRDLSQYGIGDVSEKYIRKCIELCKDHDIPVKLFVSPIYDLKLISTVDYDAYVKDLKLIAEDCDVEVYDFNLIKDEYLDIKEGQYFYDMGHLNEAGASIFTPVLWDVMTTSPTGNEDKFYNSYTEKLSNEAIEIYGAHYVDVDASTRRYTIASSRPEMKYKVIKTIESIDNADGSVTYVDSPTAEVLQNYNINNTFDLPINQHGQLQIYGSYAGEIVELKIRY